MSTTLNTVLERLRAFGTDKLGELDKRAEEHRGWLRAAVEEVAAQVAALAPASKRQRLEGGAARATAAAGEQVRAAGSRRRAVGSSFWSLRSLHPPTHTAISPSTAQPDEPARARKGRSRVAAEPAGEPAPVEPAPAEVEAAAAEEAVAAKPAPRGRRGKKQALEEEAEAAAPAKEEAAGGFNEQRRLPALGCCARHAPAVMRSCSSSHYPTPYISCPLTSTCRGGACGRGACSGRAASGQASRMRPPAWQEAAGGDSCR